MYRELLKRYLKTMIPSIIVAVIGSIIGVFIIEILREGPFSISNTIIQFLSLVIIHLFVYGVSFIIICILKKMKKF